MDRIIAFVLDPLQTLFDRFREFFPNLLAFVIVLTGGVLTALFVGYLSRRVLQAIKFDRWCDRIGLTATLRKENVWGKPSKAFSTGIFWLLYILAVMVSLGTLQSVALDNLVTEFFLYLPRVFSAVVILLVGNLATGLVSRGVLLTAVNSGYPYSRLVAEAVRLMLTVLVLAMALEQLHLAPRIVMAAFSIAFGGIVLALAVAFGVGGIPVARRMLQRPEEERETGRRKEEGKGTATDPGRDLDHI